jgi:hypothetical protein
MIIDIALLVTFLILLGLTLIKGRYAKAGILETPLMYQSVFVQFILSISMLAFLILSVFLLFFYSWKLFLLSLAIGFVTEVFIVIPLIERVLCFIVYFIVKASGINKE